MIKDARYIIKRVIIGVLIALTLSFISSCKVHALTNYTQSVDINYNVTENNNDRAFWNDANHNYKVFSNAGRGTLVTIILAYRYSETTSFELPTIHSVNARTDSGYSTCNVTSLSNDTSASTTNMKASMYGVSCDLIMGANGLISLSANFSPAVNNAFTVRVYRATFNNNLQAQEVAYEEYMYQYLQDWIYPRLNDIKNNTLSINQTDQAIYNYMVDWIYPRVNEIKQALLNTQQAIINGNNQAHTDAQAQQQATQEQTDTIKDSNIDDPSSSLSSMDGKIATNSVISDLLLMPVTLFQKVLNSINGTCSPFQLGALFDTNLVFPCINLSNLIGSSLYGVIDVLLCGIFVLSMRKRFVDIFENITSLKDRGNEIE